MGMPLPSFVGKFYNKSTANNFMAAASPKTGRATIIEK